MLFSDPEFADMKTVAVGRSPELIQAALQEILGTGKSFPFYTIVHDGPSSIRLFLQEPYADSIEMPAHMILPADIAKSLLEFTTSGARYPHQLTPSGFKGFTISEIEIAGKSAAIVIATWV